MLVQDNVCGMRVDAGENQLEYLGVSYSFCSKQCQERFQSNPHHTCMLACPDRKHLNMKGLR